MKEEIEAGSGGIANDQSFSLKKLQREHDREKEEFEKREQDYVKRLESANSENSQTEKELQELKTKILKLEVNEQNLMEEVCTLYFFTFMTSLIKFIRFYDFINSRKLQIRLAKYNLEANKHEFDEYKQRAQKILSAKENLLISLKKVFPVIFDFYLSLDFENLKY